MSCVRSPRHRARSVRRYSFYRTPYNQAIPSAHLPSRAELIAHLEDRLQGALPVPERIVLHYLDGRVEAELFLPDSFWNQNEQVARLQQRLQQFLPSDKVFSAIRLHKVTHFIGA